jgi:predicted transcriptional regulator
MQYLTHQGWIASRENRESGKGRPVRIYRLNKPIAEILDSIERKKEEEANHHLLLIRKLQDTFS